MLVFYLLKKKIAEVSEDGLLHLFREVHVWNYWIFAVGYIKRIAFFKPPASLEVWEQNLRV